MTEKNNVLLIILDSVRADSMGMYGYDRNNTPFLNEFKKRSTLYSHAYAPSTNSIESHTSIFTGKHVPEHQIKDHAAEIDTTQTIWHKLGTDQGYSTGLFTNNRIVSEASNLGDCFNYVNTPKFPKKKQHKKKLFEHAYGPLDTANEIGYINTIERCLTDDAPVRSLINCIWRAGVEFKDVARNAETEYKTIPGQEFTQSFLDWYPRQEEPWAACINLMDAHSPYVPEKDNLLWGSEELMSKQNNQPPLDDFLDDRNYAWNWLKELEPLYDSCIRQLDSILEDCIKQLESDGILDETLLVITSDHGEGFGEMSRVDPTVRLRRHSWGIHEALTHVPLIVNYPGQSSGKSIDDLASLTNFPEVVKRTLDDTGQSDMFVESNEVLSSTYNLTSEKIEKFDHIDTIEKYRGPWRAVYEQRDEKLLKHVQKGQYQITLLIEEDTVTEIVNPKNDNIIERLYGKLSKADIDTGDIRELDPEIEEHLEELGYIR